MNKFLSCFWCMCVPFAALAQEGAILKGKVVAEATKNPVSELEVTLPGQKLLTVTDGNGEFVFSQVKAGNYDVVLSNGSSIHDTVRVAVGASVTDLGTLTVATDEAAVNAATGQMPTIALEESSLSADDEGVSDQSISGVLTASRDPYLSAAAFTFGPLRYQLRGYNRDQLEVYMNGFQMNDVEIGSAFFGQWGGLNDVFRNQSVVFGLQPGEEGFGGLTGSTAINATAAAQRKQTRVSYSRANRTYNNRLMLTHSTGMMNNGWALSVSASKRWAKEGYVEGTNYDGYSYYLGVSRKLGQHSMLHFTTFGAPTTRGKAMPTTKEAMELAGSHFYNPNWGWLNGKKRNARENSSFQPIFMLNYEWNPNPATHLNIGLSYQTGYNGNSALDWYNAWDPRPDYYRKMPSYYTEFDNVANPETAEAVRQKWLTDPSVRQVNWDRLYAANRANAETFNGTTGNRSIYVVGEDRDDTKKYNFTASIQKATSEHVTLYAGVSAISQHIESYRKMLDLLGGDYYANLNQFAERTYVGNNSLNQVDLNNPDRVVRQGDKYGYDYNSNFFKTFAWAQGVFTYNRFDFFLAGRIASDVFVRDGRYKNGLFPLTSYGKSKSYSFFTYQAKGGVTYKINGRNYLFANGALMTNAPTFENTFYSPRTRNNAVPNPAIEKIQSAEGGYLLRSPRFSGRLTGFLTNTTDITKTQRFYYEGLNTFVNYVMTGVAVRNMGGELALQAKISPSFSATAVATYMQVFYTSRPTGSLYPDNDTTAKVQQNVSYLKNYHVASGPQSAYTLGLNYRSPQYWYANVNFNFLDRNYVDVNPIRRTEAAVDLLTPGSEQWHEILDQEKLPSAFTVDLFAGKSFLLSKAMKWLPRGTYLYLNVGVNNILNNKNVATGGFEQLRFDMTTGNAGHFPSKYFYGYGTNYFVNVSLKF
ncbi:MAG: carboxypeptidase-like regulatory domain-containing protein [Edaphocola sp.]